MQVFNIQEDVTSPRVKSICFHRNRSVVLIAFHNGEICAYDYSLSAYIHKFIDHDGPVRSINFHPTNDIFASGGDDQFVRIWDYTTKTHVKLKGHTDYIRCVRFHSCEPFFLSTSDDRTIKIWNFQSKKKVKTLAGHTNYVMAAEFLKDQRVVSASLDQTIRIWNIEDGTSEIIEAHDKGVNCLSIRFKMNDFVIISGSDDKNIKMFNSDLISTDSFNYHSKPVTSLISFEKTIISCGEDGFVFINKNKQTKRIERDRRFWCVARNNQNMIAAGNDNCFLIFSLKNNLVYNEKFIIRDNKMVNLRNEKVLDLKKEVRSVISHDDLFIINYTYKFEVYKENTRRMIWSESGNGLFFNNCILSEDKGEYNTFTYQGTVQEERIFNITGHPVGSQNFMYIFNEKKLVQINKKYDMHNTFLPFVIEKVSLDENFVCVCGKNDLVIMNEDLKILRHIKEMVKIFSVKVKEGIIYYTTEKQIKYLFDKTDGIICSSDSTYLVDVYEKNGKDFVLLVDEEQILEREINKDEIKFKLAVLNNEKDVIESFIGRLPGMCIINFLKENGRGEIAIPFIKNKKEKLELFLSNNDFKNAFELSETVHDYEKIIEKGLRTPEILKSKNIEFIEKALQKTNNDLRMFLFYASMNNQEKMKNTEFKEPNAILLQSIIKDDKATIIKILKNKNNIISNTPLIETEEEDSDFEESDEYFDVKDKLESQDEKKKTNRSLNSKFESDQQNIANEILDMQKLQQKEELFIQNCDYESSLDEACKFFEDGKIRESKKLFLGILYTLNVQLDENRRFLLGNYLSGIESEKKRRKEKDAKKILERIKFFYNLKLLPQHRQMQIENYVVVNYKNMNFESAKIAAKDETGKVFEQVKQSHKIGNAYDVPDGVFCCDVGEYKENGHKCLFCGCFNEKNECAICSVGIVEK